MQQVTIVPYQHRIQQFLLTMGLKVMCSLQVMPTDNWPGGLNLLTPDMP